MNREVGFYWVTWKLLGQKEPAKWIPDYEAWLVVGSPRMFGDHEFRSIGPKIEEPKEAK